MNNVCILVVVYLSTAYCVLEAQQELKCRLKTNKQLSHFSEFPNFVKLLDAGAQHLYEAG